jgi:VCBS repeat-containing protein
MSTSTATSPNPFAPVAVTDNYSVGADQILNISVNIFNNQGLLGNDRETLLGVVGGLSLTVTGCGLNPDAIPNVLSVNSDYGEWRVQPNGAFTYQASGLASKQLLEGQTATDILYYQEANLFQLTAIGQVRMEIIGVYDPLETSSETPSPIILNEDEWEFTIGSSGKRFFNPIVSIDYVDDPSRLQAYVDFTIITSPEIQNQFADELAALASQIYPSFTTVIDSSGIHLLPDFLITKADLHFLNPGEQITINMRLTVSDGRTSDVFTSDLTINGVDDPLMVAPDAADTIQNGMIQREASVSVLSNDFDPDFRGALEVFGIESNVTPWTIIFGGARGSIQGNYGSLHMFGDGTYEYMPGVENRYLLQTVTDHFVYQVMNDVQFANATLDITINPYPGVVVVNSGINQSVELDEQLNFSGIEEFVSQEEFFSYTVLVDIFAESVRDVKPTFRAQYMSDYFAPSSHLPLSRQLVSLALDQTSVEIYKVQETNIAEGLWESSFAVAFRMNKSLLFEDFDFLSEGDRITLTYEIHGEQGGSIEEGNNVFDVIYDKSLLLNISILGQNDAPIAQADFGLVYMGQLLDVSSSYSGQRLLDNDFDVDFEDHIRVSAVSGEYESSEVSTEEPGIVQGIYGTLTVHHNGSYSYQADPLSAEASSGADGITGGIDTFYYRVSDSFGEFADQILSVYVLGPNNQPVAVDDVIIIRLDEWDSANPLTNILENDTDYDPSRLTVAWLSTLPDQYLSLDERGNIFLNWSELRSLEAGESLGLSFFYTATNGTAESDIAYVEIDIIGSNETPVPENDTYFYENIAGSVFEVSQSDGLIFHQNIFGSKTDADIDSDIDSLIVSAVSIDTQHWINLTDGSAVLQLDENISVLVNADGSFVMDTSDAYRGMVSFSYLLSDGIHAAIGSAVVEVGGPAPQQGQLLINEISLDNPAVIRIAYTDNGSAPNRIPVGKGSIELLNASSQAIDTTQLAKIKIEIAGADGSAVTLIDLRHLTGLTEDANGNALNKFFIPAGGVLMLYEPGSLGFGTWALYGPDKSFIVGGSGTYVGQDWPLGSTTKAAIAINLTQNDTSIDLFAANGADVSQLTGVIGLGDTQQDEESGPGIPWAGTDIGTHAGVQYDGSISDMTDTVFARVSLTDTNSERDWGNFSRLAMTIGDVNDKLNINVRNPDDPSDNMDPQQGIAGIVGQQKSVVSGTESGDSGSDVLVGQSGDDTLAGGGGDDLHLGGGGDDSIDGGPGGDNIHGGTGADLLRGGTGNDVFVYEAITHSTQWDTDVILDFENDQDWIDLLLIDADAATPGDQMFVWVGAMSGRPEPDIAQGQVVYWMQNGMTYVQADVAGDDLPPLELILSGTQPVSAADFVL